MTNLERLRGRLHERIAALVTAEWRRARCGSKRRWRQQALAGLLKASRRAERVLTRAANRDGGAVMR